MRIYMCMNTYEYTCTLLTVVTIFFILPYKSKMYL